MICIARSKSEGDVAKIMSTAAPSIRTTFTGSLYILEQVGQGMSCLVYRTRDSSGREFALKKVPKSILANKAIYDGFVNQIRIMLDADHPHILRLYEVVEGEDFLGLVTDFCEAGDLESYMQGHAEGLSEGEAFFWMAQIASGLRYMQGRKIIHRDLKLANVFLKGRTAIIGDFGLSAYGVSTASSVLGTALFIAPEMLDEPKGGYTNKCDLWSAGVCFFYLLYGKVPFQGKNFEELKAKIMSGSGANLKPPFGSKVSFETFSILVKLLEPSVERRMEWKEFFEKVLDRNPKMSLKNQTPQPQEISSALPSPLDSPDPRPKEPLNPSTPSSWPAKQREWLCSKEALAMMFKVIEKVEDCTKFSWIRPFFGEAAFGLLMLTRQTDIAAKNFFVNISLAAPYYRDLKSQSPQETFQYFMGMATQIEVNAKRAYRTARNAFIALMPAQQSVVDKTDKLQVKHVSENILIFSEKFLKFVRTKSVEIEKFSASEAPTSTTRDGERTKAEDSERQKAQDSSSDRVRSVELIFAGKTALLLSQASRQDPALGDGAGDWEKYFQSLDPVKAGILSDKSVVKG